MPSLLTPPRHILSKQLATLVVEKEWQIARARYQLKDIANQLGFSCVYAAQLITSLSELGYNLVFHSDNGGVIYVSRVIKANSSGIKLICVDNGPGIPCIINALTDGFSTNGGLGGGLPGVERLMDDFFIESTNQGTRIECTKWAI